MEKLKKTPSKICKNTIALVALFLAFVAVNPEREIIQNIPSFLLAAIALIGLNRWREEKILERRLAILDKITYAHIDNMLEICNRIKILELVKIKPKSKPENTKELLIEYINKNPTFLEETLRIVREVYTNTVKMSLTIDKCSGLSFVKYEEFEKSYRSSITQLHNLVMITVEIIRITKDLPSIKEGENFPKNSVKCFNDQTFTDYFLLNLKFKTILSTQILNSSDEIKKELLKIKTIFERFIKNSYSSLLSEIIEENYQIGDCLSYLPLRHAGQTVSWSACWLRKCRSGIHLHLSLPTNGLRMKSF